MKLAYHVSLSRRRSPVRIRSGPPRTYILKRSRIRGFFVIINTVKTIFLIRGFSLKKTAASPDFKDLRNQLTRLGYRVVPVDTLWDYKTVSRFVQEFSILYQQQKSDYNIIIGSSLGAVAAMVSAPHLLPDELFLCSLSRVFVEDLTTARKNKLLRKLGQRRLKDLELFSAKNLIHQLNATSIKTSLFYGEKEKVLNPLLVAKVKERTARLSHAQLIEIPNAGHGMRESQYTQGLSRFLSDK